MRINPTPGMSCTRMIVRHLKHIKQYRDRHGKLRRYFCAPGQPQIPLPGDPGSDEFLAAYSAALTQRCIGRKIEHSPLGSFSAVITAYYCDQSFTTLGESTRKMRRRILEILRKQHGSKPFSLMRQKDIVTIIGKQKPFESPNWLKTLRGLMKFAVANGHGRDDPTAGLKKTKVKAGRIHTWDEAEIARYETRHPVGTKARLAMALMLYTGQRKSDMVRMGPQHI